jgi:uncharacterized oligopeptide transporter (OPT) family protein
MYGLQLLSTPQQDFGKLLGLSIVCAFYGTFFAIPLRKFYILHIKLVFPEAIAVSFAIRALHLHGDERARRQIICLAVVFVAAFVWNVCRDYAPGILGEWHFFYWISLFTNPGVMAPDNWGWGVVDTTPCFFGLGMIIGLNAALSFYAGCILAWGILGPITVATGLAAGKLLPSGRWIYVSSAKGSPRYWLLWPGVFMMLCASVAEVAVCYKPIWRGIKLASKETYNTIRRRPFAPESSVDDPMGPQDQVPIWVSVHSFIANLLGLATRTACINGSELCSPESTV